jgi:hypothetical protein
LPDGFSKQYHSKGDTGETAWRPAIKSLVFCCLRFWTALRNPASVILDAIIFSMAANLFDGHYEWALGALNCHSALLQPLLPF